MPELGVMSADSIHTAYQRYQSFIVSLNHLRDVLIQEADTFGMSRDKMEAMIRQALKNDDQLGIVADLANLEKHPEFLRKSWTGFKPEIKISGVDLPDGHGWRLEVVVKHNGLVLDGMNIASDAVQGWIEFLEHCEQHK